MPRLHGRRAAFWKWAFALALLGGVFYAAGRFIQRGDLLRLMRRARPQWLAAAVALQAATYLAQGEVWRAVARAGGRRLRVTRAYDLSLAKLFVDQAVPSAGFSGTAFAARALRRGGLARPAAAACVAINQSTYFAAYAIALAAGALAAARRTRLLALAAAVFLAIAAGVALLFRRSSRRPPRGLLAKTRVVRRVFEALAGADPRLLRSLPLFLKCAGLQLIVIALDAASMWILLRALGTRARPEAVFASFMLANAARSVSFVPGGLGPFEASSVWALERLAKTGLAAALSATLLFRLLSFWLPMLPGFFSSRRAYRA